MVFNQDGGIKPQSDLKESIYFPSPEIADLVLKARFAPVYRLVDTSLAPVRDGGFNLHSKHHIDSVTSKTSALLQSANVESEALQRGIIAARGHDLGNLFSRSYHEILAAEISQRMIPGITEKADWDIIQRAMLLHNGSVRTLIPLWDQMGVNERVSLMREFGPEVNALFIADKTDIGRQRVNNLPFDVLEYDIDPHSEVNLLGRTNQAARLEDTFGWELDFAPGMKADEIEKYPHYSMQRTNHEGWRARASNMTHLLWRTENIPQFDIWRRQFWTLYLQNIERVVWSAFALYPKLKNFQITINDSEAFTKLDHTFGLGDIDPFFDMIKTKYLPKEMRLRR